MHVRHAGFDEAPELELMATLGNLHGPNLAGPLEDILKQVVVDRAEVAEVEVSQRDAFRYALGNEQALDPAKLGSVGQAKAISQNVGTRIDVGVACVHSAASLRPRARM